MFHTNVEVDLVPGYPTNPLIYVHTPVRIEEKLNAVNGLLGYFYDHPEVVQGGKFLVRRTKITNAIKVTRIY